jgi:hypothetical protein
MTWEVSIRSHRATVKREEVERVAYKGAKPYILHNDTVTVHGSNGDDYTFTYDTGHRRSEADLLALVLGYFAAVEDMQQWCDQQLALGTDGPFAKLTKKSTKALETAMIALSRGLGLVALDAYGEGMFALVVPGLFVRYFGTERGYKDVLPPRAFFVGDECVVGSYNLLYLGHVTKVTDRFVWVRDRHAKQKRHTLDSFSSYNRCTVAEARTHNQNEMMYI